MPKKRVQYILVKATFNKPITRAQAKIAFADSIHGSFYINTWNDEGATVFAIRSVKPAPLGANGKPITSGSQ